MLGKREHSLRNFDKEGKATKEKKTKQSTGLRHTQKSLVLRSLRSLSFASVGFWRAREAKMSNQ